MTYATRERFASLDSVFAGIKTYWHLFERCTLDDLFIGPALREKLRSSGIDSFQTLVNTREFDLRQYAHVSTKDMKRLKKCAIVLLERETYPPEGFDILLKRLRELEDPRKDRPLAGGVSVRASNALGRASIFTYRDLSRITEEQLSSIRNFGKKSMDSVVAAVQRFLDEPSSGESVAPNQVPQTPQYDYPMAEKGRFIALLQEAFAETTLEAKIPEEVCAFIREKTLQAIMACAKKVFAPREADIFEKRNVLAKKDSFEELGRKYGVTSARIRQLSRKSVMRIEGLFRRNPLIIREQTEAFYSALCMLDAAQLRFYADYILRIGDIDAVIIAVVARDARIALPSAYAALTDAGSKKGQYGRRKKNDKYF